MSFAHLADVHIGAWRDPAMKRLGLEAFEKAVSIILGRKPDFVLIAGDLFNTAMPGIDHLKHVVILLRKLKEAGMPVYAVPGSHDYSPTGRTILDVLEEAELLVNVMKGEVADDKLKLKFTVDKKTGAKITGVRGRKGSLEKKEFEKLDAEPLEEESGFKIFMFHTALDELKPAELEMMDSMPARELPRNFDYYAGGHVHIVKHKSISNYKNLVYPGPVFPANFYELWKLGRGGFYFYDNGKLEFMPVEMKAVVKLGLDADGKSAQMVSHELEDLAEKNECKDAIVLIRIKGKLKSGKPSDIRFRKVFEELYNKHAYFVMRNTSSLSSQEFEQVQVHQGTAEEVEEEIIKRHLEKTGRTGKDALYKDEQEVIKNLLSILSEEEKEGEKKYEYKARISQEVDKVLELLESNA